MIAIRNVSVYDDDNEIVNLLHTMPKNDSFEGLTILEFLQRRTGNSDFGVVIFYDHKAFTLYKFGADKHTEEHRGLILTVSSDQFCDEQLEIWQTFKEEGMSFNPSYYQQMQVALIGATGSRLLFGGSR